MKKFIKIKNTISLLVKLVKKKKVLAIFILVLFCFALLSGSVLAYSIKLKNEGDKAYQNQNYQEALNKYKLSQKYWFPETISYKLRDRDLYLKIDKASIMVKSGEYYAKGVTSFENKQYTEAKQYLSSLVLKDPNYQKAQELLAIIEKESLPKPASTLTIKPYKIPTNDQSNSIFATTPVTTAVVPTSAIPTPTPSYNDLHCPKIVKLEDSLGNTLSNDWYLRGTFKKGEVKAITIKVTMIDPQNLPLYYQFFDESSLTSLPQYKWLDWSTENSIVLNLKDDISPGTQKLIRFKVDNRDGFACYVDADLQGVINYTVLP